MATKKKRTVRTKPAKEIYVVTDSSLVGDDLDIHSLASDSRMSEDLGEAKKLAQDVFDDLGGEIRFQTERLNRTKNPTAFYYSEESRRETRAEAEKSLKIATNGQKTITITVYKPVKKIVFKPMVKKAPAKKKVAAKRKK